jgi:hypothetical protein
MGDSRIIAYRTAADGYLGTRRHRNRQDKAGSSHHTLPRIRTAGQRNEHGGEIGCVLDWCWVLRALR